MKMITAIIQKEDSRAVCKALLREKFYVTKLPTTGGFLSTGNITLLIGTEDTRVDTCIACIARHCRQRTEIVPGDTVFGPGLGEALPTEVPVGGATVFVTNVERFEKL